MPISMDATDLKPNLVIQGPLFPEPVQIITTIPLGDSIKLIGKGLQTGLVHEPILTTEQIATLQANPENEPFDGDAQRFRLGIEAMRIGLAYEYDPYFSLSIARVDPLPHQLEAVYDYFLKLPRIRFLLADDPGAGKTIMAGLLIKELKIRGLIKRVLIVTPANLTFQWQRELKDKFRENFEIIRGEVLRANYGSNPWQERDQVITSVSWVSIIEDANESLLRSRWDLIIVDEAHKMSARREDDLTYAYRLGMALSERTDHYLLMTATPHKGDPQNFRLFLELLDKDVYGNIKSLEEAMRRHAAPFYLRRVKEALVDFPDPDTGQVKKLFTRRNVRTAAFQLNPEEGEFYDELTRFVENQSIKASKDDSARGRALGFTMAMLQRRFASSIYAARRSLERMKAKREKILADPDGYRQEQILKKTPDDFDDLPEAEQEKIIAQLEEIVASVDPIALRAEIAELDKLIVHAQRLESCEVETKLTKLQEVINEQGVFHDPKMKLLIFTEHKDSLDYLVKKLEAWGLIVTQIHGGLKIGDRNTPHTRLCAEREFRESCQVLVATEAAGEGINLQFCWLLINYDIPWNPVRLEQRMGRIHRYGQQKDCLIFNFVATNTREGRVMQKLFDRIRQIETDLDPQQTGSVFNVLGEVLPANQIERWLRDMYAHNLTEKVITDRIIEQVDSERFRSITHSTLEGLAKRELNLSAIIGKSAEAKERRLVPEVIADFFVQAAPHCQLEPKPGNLPNIYKLGKVPRQLWPLGEKLESRFGKLGREYKNIVFDKECLHHDPTLEWVTPGHPLFEVVRESILATVESDLSRGAVFYDLHRDKPVLLDVFLASVVDGRGQLLHRRLLVVESDSRGDMVIRQPTLFLDLIPAQSNAGIPDASLYPDRNRIEQAVVQLALYPLLDEVSQEREQEIGLIQRHLDISLTELIHRENLKQAELLDRQQQEKSFGLQQAINNTEHRIDELNHRLEQRRKELNQERHCVPTDIRPVARAWVLPYPERKTPEFAPMVRDEDIERIAVEAVMAYEEARGWTVVSVESENRGFDLISRCPHSEDPQTAIAVRFIEVKGRAGVGEIALTSNEYKTAQRLKNDYWLYVVFDCAKQPEVRALQNPALLDWEPVVKVEHFHVPAASILEATGIKTP
jgi:superfamily II DNA or RNA helicase